MGKSTLVLHNKVLLKYGVVVEMKIWDVREDEHYPEGHHRHIGAKEEDYSFSTLENLRNDFKADLKIQIAKRGLT